MLEDALYISVDLGAGSGRVFLIGLAPGELLLEEIRRFYYRPVEIDGHLRWDADEIFKQLTEGAREAAARARSLGRFVQSIAVDSWGVDYGLLNSKGELVEPPICYRDQRTAGMMEAVFQLIDRREIFSRTGIQVVPINTLFQPLAHELER